MKCPNCGVDYSDKVYEIHKHICKPKKKEVKKNISKSTIKNKTISAN